MCMMKKQDKFESVGVRLPPSILEFVEEKSKETTISKSALIRKYVVQKVRELQQEEGGSDE